MENFLNEKYYLPLLKNFVKEAGPLYSCNYPFAPFIPYTMPLYNKSSPKIMYMGRDPNYWAYKEDLFNQKDISKYFDINKNCVSVDNETSSKRIIDDYGKTGTFWNFVAKLHLAINGRSVKEDVNELTKDDIDCLKTIAYGNLRAIELYQVLDKQGYWKEDKKENYEGIEKYKDDFLRLVESTAPFETFKNIIEAYNPDIIFVLSWSCGIHTFDGVKDIHLSKYYEKDICEVHRLEGYDTKIIWSSHPSRYSRMGLTVEGMIEKLTSVYNEIK